MNGVSPLNPDYQVLNNRQWLLDQTLRYVDALLCAAEPLKALAVLQSAVPVVLEGLPRIVALTEEVRRRAAHATDFEQFKALYGNYAASIGEPISDTNMLTLSRVQMVLDLLEQHRPARILEIGTGDGTIANAILALVPQSTLTVADISDSAAVVAALVGRHGPRVTFHRTTNDMYDWPAGVYDAVIAMEVVEHVEDQEGFLRNCREKLTSGGVLYVTTPDADFWVERNLFQRDAPTPFQHLVANTPRSLVAKAAVAGLSTTFIKPSVERHIVALFQRI